jgi:hypothetical protein
MESNFLPDKDKDFAAWMTRFITVANANLVATGLSTTQITQFQTRATDFNNAISAVEQQKAALKGTTLDKNLKRKAAATMARDFNRSIQGKLDVTPKLKTDLGLNPRTRKPAPLDPFEPMDLSAVGSSNGGNLLTWKHGKNKTGTVYEIEVKYGTDGDWQVLTAVTKTRFQHQDAPAGVQTMYRVRAKRRSVYSIYSATATVYAESVTPVLTLQKAA